MIKANTNAGKRYARLQAGLNQPSFASRIIIVITERKHRAPTEQAD
jgi:hypothetical protein